MRVFLRLSMIIFLNTLAFILPKSSQVSSGHTSGPAKNIILFIGDGMGFEHVAATGMYASGAKGIISFEAFNYQAEMTTQNATNNITDSAASATAIATCAKVKNHVISVTLPGDGSELRTVLEVFQSMGKSTGLVTTSYITDATPAAFGAHESNRNNKSQIAEDYLAQTRPNILFGGGGNGMSKSDAEDAGYTVMADRNAMQAIDTEKVTYVAGIFGNDALPSEYDGLGNFPSLSEMTQTALNILDNDPDGFFLLVEQEGTDSYAHTNDIKRTVFAAIELSNAVKKALDWAAGRKDTLIIVTADHETGGLSIIQNNGPGNFPTVSWLTGGHTSATVPVYAWGANAELVKGKLDNIDICRIMLTDESSHP